MSALLDTHFVLWITAESRRLQAFPWLDGYRPWWVSPVSFLEIQFLSEVGRADVNASRLATVLARDPRFVVDEVPVASLIAHALPLSWTRDPFDRLVSAHSLARRIPLCTVDGTLRKHHALLVPDLRGPPDKGATSGGA